MDEGRTNRSLCEICWRLHQVTENYQTIDFGTIEEIQLRHSCGVCQLVLGLLPITPTTKSQLQNTTDFNAPGGVELRKMGRPAFYIWYQGTIQGEIGYFYPREEGEIHQIVGLPLRDISNNWTSIFDHGKASQWVAKCNSDHLDCSKARSISSLQLPIETLLIDTIENCLVHSTTSARYLTLSYVRGGTAMFETTSANYTLLQEPGALCRVMPLLDTIVQDALECTRRLGERYIWIDTLCIPQDNDNRKAELIMQMDVIYSHAFLTLIALVAENAQCPLPGIRPNTRLKNVGYVQYSVSEKDPTLPNRYIAARSSFFSLRELSAYDSRGWTFQESMLSRRCLIFTDHQVFFHCNSEFDSDCRGIGSSDVWPGRTILSSILDKQENFHDPSKQFELYTRLVHDFSRRKLSFSEDCLKAIGGILAVFHKRLRWRFVAGMPSHLLEHALLWRSASHNSLRNPKFPSWSWAGWIGQSTWALQNLMDTVQFGNNGEVPLVPLQSKAQIAQEDAGEGQVSSNIELNARGFMLHIRSQTVLANAFRILNSTSNLFKYQATVVPLFPFKEIWTKDGVRCGILYDFHDDAEGDYKFIALSRFKWARERFIWRGRLYDGKFLSWYGHICDDKELEFSEVCLMNVMLVKVKEGAVERVGIGLIHNDIWQAVAEQRETILLR